MSANHDEVRKLLGAYVLGGLNDEDRRTIDDHLLTCEVCGEELALSAPVVEFLGLAGPRAARPDALFLGGMDDTAPGLDRAVPPAAKPSKTSLERLLGQIRAENAVRRRRSRMQWFALAAALIVIAGLGIGLVAPWGGDGDDPSARLTASVGFHATGEAILKSKPWGTSLDLKVTGMPQNGPFTLRVISVDGRQEQAAAWATTSKAKMAVVGATSMHPSDITSLAVYDNRGHMVARGAVDSL